MSAKCFCPANLKFIGQNIISMLQLLFLFAACPSGQRPVGEVCEA